MRTANRIDIASLHQLNILAHALFGDGIAGDRVELVSVHASQLDGCTVDSEYAFSIDLIMAEAEGHSGFLQLFFSQKSRQPHLIQIGCLRRPEVRRFQLQMPIRCCGDARRNLQCTIQPGRIKTTLFKYRFQADLLKTITVVASLSIATAHWTRLGIQQLHLYPDAWSTAMAQIQNFAFSMQNCLFRRYLCPEIAVQKVQLVDFIQFNAAKDSRQPPHILTFEIGTWAELIHPKQQ